MAREVGGPQLRVLEGSEQKGLPWGWRQPWDPQGLLPDMIFVGNLQYAELRRQLELHRLAYEREHGVALAAHPHFELRPMPPVPEGVRRVGGRRVFWNCVACVAIVAAVFVVGGWLWAQ